MRKTAHSLMMHLHGRGADTTAMLDGWIKLSEAKGWPTTEEGWSRYLGRANESETFPKRKKESGKVWDATPQPPADFVAWWSQHTESEGGPPARVAFSCQMYRNEWMEWKAAQSQIQPVA